MAVTLLLAPSAAAGQPFPTEERFYEDTEPPTASGRIEIPACGRIRPTGSPPTLGAAARNLATALDSAGYSDAGWFLTHRPKATPGPPDSSQVNGFAVVTPLVPVTQPFNLWTILKGAPPRRAYAVAIFVVRGAFGRRPAEPIEHDEAEAWSRRGSATRFTRLDLMPWQSQDCVALVYMYERTSSQGGWRMVRSVDARQHLREVGLWQALTGQ